MEKRVTLKEIIVSDSETHQPVKQEVYSSKGKLTVERMRTQHEVMMLIANERAGVSDNLLWHGYEHKYNPDKKEHVFLLTQ